MLVEFLVQTNTRNGETLLLFSILPLVGSLTVLKYMLLYFMSPDSVQYNFSVYKLCNLSVCMDVIPVSFDFWTFQTFDCQNVWFTLQLIHAKNWKITVFDKSKNDDDHKNRPGFYRKTKLT